jgi:hypothetical protein
MTGGSDATKIKQRALSPPCSEIYWNGSPGGTERPTRAEIHFFDFLAFFTFFAFFAFFAFLAIVNPLKVLMD